MSTAFTLLLYLCYSENEKGLEKWRPAVTKRQHGNICSVKSQSKPPSEVRTLRFQYDSHSDKKFVLTELRKKSNR